MTKRAARRLAFETRILLLTLGTGLPGTAVAIALLWTGSFSPEVRWISSVMIVVAWVGFARAVRQEVRFPLQTISNLLSGIREGDFSIRARGEGHNDAFGEVLAEVNT